MGWRGRGYDGRTRTVMVIGAALALVLSIYTHVCWLGFFPIAEPEEVRRAVTGHLMNGLVLWPQGLNDRKAYAREYRTRLEPH